MAQDVPPEERGMVSQFGPIEVDWPRTIGYYGGVALAVAFELIEPPVGIFIASIPLIKMLSRPKASQPVRFASEMLQGAAIPLNGDAEASIRIQSGSDTGEQDQQGDERAHDGQTTAKRHMQPAQSAG